MDRPISGRRAYRSGFAVAVATAFLIVWTTIVRDDGNGIGFFMVVMAMAVGTGSAWFRAPGMARTMLGVAIMQMVLGILIASAPSTASTPNGPIKILLSTCLFMMLWLISAAFFRAAARAGTQTAALFR